LIQDHKMCHNLYFIVHLLNYTTCIFNSPYLHQLQDRLNEQNNKSYKRMLWFDKSPWQHNLEKTTTKGNISKRFSRTLQNYNKSRTWVCFKKIQIQLQHYKFAKIKIALKVVVEFFWIGYPKKKKFKWIIATQQKTNNKVMWNSCN
jgi:hypothetical protein